MGFVRPSLVRITPLGTVCTPHLVIKASFRSEYFTSLLPIIRAYFGHKTISTALPFSKWRSVGTLLSVSKWRSVGTLLSATAKLTTKIVTSAVEMVVEHQQETVSGKDHKSKQRPAVRYGQWFRKLAEPGIKDYRFSPVGKCSHNFKVLIKHFCNQRIEYTRLAYIPLDSLYNISIIYLAHLTPNIIS